MDFTAINALFDAAVAFILASVEREQNYKQQLAQKDEQLAQRDQRITDLESQLTTTNALVSADETELTTLHDKLAQLSGILTPATEPAAA
ncbi:hypothetical protein [Nostoc sp. 106C]|uniref:hypothetical protein n=1 Tax=Nostoc sp. 106C TaxID=1932667 RepID=UPI000A3769BF|nr:hypothetical protein [Nostoc sp. 106C]OUL28285.1 hypothetical protein BV378_07635 [Nostoc sp. RF31YmG]OUL34095.1 hypothetical protein BV375_05295 [Nostoc sp. 106C]